LSPLAVEAGFKDIRSVRTHAAPGDRGLFQEHMYARCGPEIICLCSQRGRSGEIIDPHEELDGKERLMMNSTVTGFQQDDQIANMQRHL
jgi:hypothetical protein